MTSLIARRLNQLESLVGNEGPQDYLVVRTIVAELFLQYFQI